MVCSNKDDHDDHQEKRKKSRVSCSSTILTMLKHKPKNQSSLKTLDTEGNWNWCTKPYWLVPDEKCQFFGKGTWSASYFSRHIILCVTVEFLVELLTNLWTLRPIMISSRRGSQLECFKKTLFLPYRDFPGNATWFFASAPETLP